LYVALEEGPEQIHKIAEALGLPLDEAVNEGLAEVVFPSRAHVRANQLLTILTDKVRASQARRLVLDSASHVMTEGLSSEELRQLLYALAGQFKALGVTTLLTLESQSMYSTDSVTDGGFSPVADNIILLRYAQVPGEIRPTLAVVKTRGSLHDRGTYYFDIAKGGMRIGDRIDGAAPTGRKAPRARESRRRPLTRAGWFSSLIALWRPYPAAPRISTSSIHASI
jgi:circadian clock protein KaiC